MANRPKEEKKPVERICALCGKPVIGVEPVYIKTRRRTELWIHPGCIRKESKDGEAADREV